MIAMITMSIIMTIMYKLPIFKSQQIHWTLVFAILALLAANLFGLIKESGEVLVGKSAAPLFMTKTAGIL